MEAVFGASFATKIPALLGGISVLLGQISTLFDADSKTNPDITLCLGTIAMVFSLFQARANKVTSEEAGAGTQLYR